MSVYYRDDRVTLHHGDCIEVLRTLPDASVDSVVTDPPYGLEFMGKDWDAPWKASSVGRGVRVESERAAEMTERGKGHSTPGGPFLAARVDSTRVAGKPFQDWCEAWATECLRVLKPGGHLLAFGGTRTWHRLACAVEDAGFEVRDSIAWMHGQGFPKSLDVSKAIDKRANVNDETHRRIALVAEVIRTHREAKGMERSAVSLAVVGTPSGACWNWEHQQLPSAEMWPAIKRALDIPDKFDGLIEGTRAQFIGAEREVIGERMTGLGTGRGAVAYIGDSDNRDVTAPATDAAREWEGWGTALKPAFEPVVCARKPFNAVPFEGEANRLHHLLGGLLWLSLSPVKRAELDSLSSRPGPPGAWCASALAGAATATSRDASAETDTFSSPALASTLLSIVSSWNATLAALSAPTSTSTTSTRSSTTTALRTLSSLLAPLTSPTTMPTCGCLHGGFASSASSAEWGSTDEWAKWLHTLNTSVPATATEGIALVVASALAQLAASLSDDPEAGSSAVPTATTGAGARRSAFEPVVVARKPLAGTVAANVLEYGCGAINIDGCRIQADGSSGQGRSGEAPARGCRVHDMRPLREADGTVEVAGREGEMAHDLRAGVPERADARGEQSQLAGRELEGQEDRVQVRLSSEPQPRGPSAPADAAAAGVSRAPLGHGPQGGQAAHVGRDGASHQRSEGRQPAGEPAPDRLGGTQQGAPADRAGTDATPSGERSPAGCTCGGTGRVGEASADRRYTDKGGTNFAPLPGVRGGSPAGRWPANVVLDESQAGALDEQSGERPGFATQNFDGTTAGKAEGWGNIGAIGGERREGFNDTGGASRFFYVAKAPTSERPRYTRPKLRLRDDLTPAQVDHVRARLAEAGVQVD